jgi:hypothetical protein
LPAHRIVVDDQDRRLGRHSRLSVPQSRIPRSDSNRSELSAFTALAEKASRYKLAFAS